MLALPLTEFASVYRGFSFAATASMTLALHLASLILQSTPEMITVGLYGE